MCVLSRRFAGFLKKWVFCRGRMLFCEKSICFHMQKWLHNRDGSVTDSWRIDAPPPRRAKSEDLPLKTLGSGKEAPSSHLQPFESHLCPVWDWWCHACCYPRMCILSKQNALFYKKCAFRTIGVTLFEWAQKSHATDQKRANGLDEKHTFAKSEQNTP